MKSDANLIRVETGDGLTGMGAALGTPPIVAAIVEVTAIPMSAPVPEEKRFS